MPNRVRQALAGSLLAAWPSSGGAPPICLPAIPTPRWTSSSARRPAREPNSDRTDAAPLPPAPGPTLDPMDITASTATPGPAATERRQPDPGPGTIREAAERNVALLALRPSRGLLTCTTRARLVGGLRCEIEEGRWRLAADLPAKVGGGDTAPTPGVLGRAALAGCLVIGIATWAARLGVPIDGLEVEAEADFDARGELGMGEGVPAGYSEVRYAVAVESPAPRDELDRLLDLALRHSPYLDVFGRAIPLRGVRRVNGEGA